MSVEGAASKLYDAVDKLFSTRLLVYADGYCLLCDAGAYGADDPQIWTPNRGHKPDCPMVGLTRAFSDAHPQGCF